MSVVTGPDVG